MRQLLIFILYVLFVSDFAFAKPPTDSTIVIPSPQNEKLDDKKEPITDLTDKNGLLIPKPAPEIKGPPTYHLEPRPSLTLALSRAYESSADEHSGWLGVHVAPWMTATTRTQLGLDIRDNYGWLQVALHSLPTRNLYRFYWGGGVSLLFDAQQELRPLLRLRNYHAFLAGGWELQLLDKQNVRFEATFHQGTETAFIKATLGYTFLF